MGRTTTTMLIASLYGASDGIPAMYGASSFAMVAPPKAPASIAHQRDADLDRRQEIAGRVRKVQRRPRALVALVGELLETGLRPADDGDLGHGEETR